MKIYGLRYLGTALIWATAFGALWFAARPRNASPLLPLPLVAYSVGVAVYVLMKFSYRYAQPYYWLGWVSLYLCASAARYHGASAKVAELADAPDLGSGGATREGSNPSFRTSLRSRATSRRVRFASARSVKAV